MAPRQRCPVCRSKQWHKEPSSGLIACSEGHILQNYRNEATEAEDMGIHAVRKRTLKSARKKKEKLSKADPQLYHGARGSYLYFQCQQLILRKQIAALVALWNLPPEFEVICRDIWALHLSLLPNPPPAEPYYNAVGDEDRPTKEEDIVHNRSPLTPDTREPTPREKTKSEDPSSSSSSDESDTPEAEVEPDEDHDPELAQLLRENSEYSSSSDEEDQDDAERVPEVTKKRKRHGRNPLEGPASAIAVLMVACWTLRIPVLYRDFYSAIEAYKLPYLDPVRLLPQSITIHLTKHNIQALSPHQTPRTLSLHTHTSRLAKRLFSSFAIFTPEVNAAPVLWRVVRCFGGTPTLYRLTKRLSHILSLPLTLHHSLAPGLRRIKNRDPESHKYDNVPPEVAFVSATIVVLKMVYGLDGKSRVPRDPVDPACALPTIDEFLAMVNEMNDASSKQQNVIHSTQTPMLLDDFDEQLVDKYLDFCEGALLGTDADLGLDDHQVLANYFPLVSGRDPISASVPDAGNKHQHGATLVAAIGDYDDSLRPGESYMIYNSRDVLGTRPKEMESVVHRGATWVGVDEAYVCGVVEKFERRLLRWWQREKRRSREGRMRGGEGSELLDDVDDDLDDDLTT